MSDDGKNASPKQMGIIGAIVAALALLGHGVVKKIGAVFRAIEKPAIEAVEHSGGKAMRAAGGTAINAAEHAGSGVAQKSAQAAQGLERAGTAHAAEELSHAKVPRISPSMALSPGMALTQSERIGQKLSVLRIRIPAHVYGRLYAQWQRNHSEIKECREKLGDPILGATERENFKERLVAAKKKSDEIERLMADYG
jgi:hypothetical protein